SRFCCRGSPPRLGWSRGSRLFADHCRNLPILSTLSQDQFDVRNAPLIPVRASLRRRTNPLHARTVVRYSAFHIQVVDFDIQPLLGRQKVCVVERRLQQLTDVLGYALLGEQQGVARFFDAAALDQIQHQPRLLWRNPQVFFFCSKFHSRNLSSSSRLKARSSKPSVPPVLIRPRALTE